MSRKMLQGIGLGILFSTSIFTYHYFFTEEEKVIEDDSIVQESFDETLQQYLQLNNLIILNKEDYDQLIADTTIEEDPEEQLTEQAPTPQEEIEDTQEEVETPAEIVIIIKAGMSSLDVSKLLEEAKIIEDARNFEDYVQERKLSTKIKAGSYLLSPGMTFAEIVEIIT